MKETFRRYIPKAEVESLKAELAERTVRESGAQGSVEVKGQVAVPVADLGDTGNGPGPATVADGI